MTAPRRKSLTAWLSEGVTLGFITAKQAMQAMPQKDAQAHQRAAINRQALLNARPGSYSHPMQTERRQG